MKHKNKRGRAQTTFEAASLSFGLVISRASRAGADDATCQANTLQGRG
jgi:hypothetical protein